MGKPIGGPRKGEKKLSWSYRNKKRQAKNKNREDDSNDRVQVQNQKARIVIRNLSFKVTEDDIKKLYQPFGPIEQIDLLRRPDGKPVGCGFVQFKRVEDASKAIFNTNKKEFLGRPINSSWAIPKSKYYEQIGRIPKSKSDDTSEVNDDESPNDNEEPKGEEDIEENMDIPIIKKTKVKREKDTESKEEDKALRKQMRKLRRARIIVRNLSFQTTGEDLKKHFAKYGNITEAVIMRREDKKPMGCAFVQFELAQDAMKAIHYENMKEFQGRQIVIDRAMPKHFFQKKLDEEKSSSDSNNCVKKEEDDEVTEVEVKEEVESEEEEENEDKNIKDEEEEDEEENEDVEEEEEEDEDEEEEKDEEDEEDDNKMEDSIKEETRSRPRVISNDVNEGKTVFLKNVPFSVKNEELKECMEQFGPVYYALVCMDPLTEHSKGTAFVKFHNVEDAEKCLSAGTELRLQDQVLDPHRALNRNAVQDTKGLKEQKSKDSRNLYLVKEGVILAGSPAAVGLSAGDMAKRLQMEQWKSQMLRNLNMFVSRVRLVVHNLPPTLDDSQLREIFKKHAGPKAVIQEARVMRDLKNADEKGVGKSKEFGFVAFTSHEDALKALRSINNNPNIFSKTKRPIVAFSIENRVMVNAKKRRVLKSRERNPLWNRDRSETKKDEPSRKRARVHDTSNNETEENNYSGVKSKPGVQKMRSKFNLKSQAILHHKVRKGEKKQAKEARKLLAKKREARASRKEVKPKQGMKKVSADEKNFNKMVDKYKSKLQALPNIKSKWYDT